MSGLPGTHPGQATPPNADWMRLLARQVVEELSGPRRRGVGPANLRRVEIIAIDPPTETATVVLDGDTDNPIVGVKTMRTYVPLVGDIPWCWQSGSALILAGDPLYILPKVKIRKGNTSAIPNNTNTIIDFGATPAIAGNSDRYNMFDAGVSQERLTLPWPGMYHVGYQSLWVDAAGGRRIAEVIDNSGNQLASDRTEADPTNVDEITCNPASLFVGSAGDYIRAQVFQTSGGPLSIQDTQFSNVMWAYYMS